MCSVERVVGERYERLPELRDRFIGEAIGLHSVAERDVLLVEDLLLLLTHRASEQVGGAEAVPGELLGDRHDLFLINDQPVRITEYFRESFLKLWVNRDDLLAAVLSVGVVVVRVDAHGTGSIQGDNCRDVVEACRRHRTQQRPHRTTVELENAEGVPAAQQLVRRFVVEFEILRNDLDAGIRFDCVHTVVDHREVAKAKEVHLQQAKCLAHTHIELGNDRAVLLTLPNRNDVNQRFAAQDDAGGVDSRLALEALKAFGRVDDFGNVCVGVIKIAKLPRLGVARVFGVEDAGQWNVLAHDGWWHCLSDLVTQGIGHS